MTKEAIIKTRDPETLEMEYAIGFKEGEARLFLDLLREHEAAFDQDEIGFDVCQALERIKDRLQWVVKTAEADRQKAADRTADELP